VAEQILNNRDIPEDKPRAPGNPRDGISILITFQELDKNYNSAVEAAIKAIKAAQECKDEHAGVTIDPILGAVGIITVGAPVVQLPPPNEPPNNPPEVIFIPVVGPPEVAPIVAVGVGIGIGIKGAVDPNDMTGPAGFGLQGFIQPGTFSYRVDFENDPAHATAAAQIVTTTLTLDPNLDPSTFQFTGFGFGKFNFTIPDGLYHYSTILDLRPDGINLFVPVTLDENQVTGVVTVKFESLDPLTKLAPDGINDGFLPVDNPAGDGEGFFTYVVQTKASLPTGTAIAAQASIVFDTNAPLATPTAQNTLDVGRPTSTVTALPATSPTTFTVSWSGTDDANGSGIAHYDIFVSDNGGVYTLWQNATAQTFAMYPGQPGHTYSFYSVASDNVGNREIAPATADATTMIAAAVATTIQLKSDHPTGALHGQTVKITATVAATQGGGVPTGTVQFFVDGVKTGSAVNLSNGLANINLLLSVAQHHITATYTSTDAAFLNTATTIALTQTVKPAPLTITASQTVKASSLTVVLKGKIVIHDSDKTARLTVHVTTTLGKFHVKTYGVTVTGNGTGKLTLTGHPAALQVALNALSLQLRKRHSQGTITVTASDGSQTRRATIHLS
jgi:hypothetical protein